MDSVPATHTHTTHRWPAAPHPGSPATEARCRTLAQLESETWTGVHQLYGKRSARHRMAGSPRAFRQAALLGYVEIQCGMGYVAWQFHMSSLLRCKTDLDDILQMKVRVEWGELELRDEPVNLVQH